jgi:hypothetical protein
MDCNTNDYMFPMAADIYYPIVEQGALGNVKKNWILDKSVAISVNPAGAAFKEEVVPNINITKDTLLVGRVKKDIRVSSRNDNNAITNVIITNIRDRSCNEIYLETSGIRNGKSTIFEIATQEPFVGPFGDIEYYKIILRRSENQAADI